MAMEKLGSWAFVIGLIIAVVMGLVSYAGATTIWILAFLGLVVGLLNVTGEESQHFLIAGIAFIVSASSLARVLPLEVVQNMLGNIVVIVSPATAVVAIKALFDIAKSR